MTIHRSNLSALTLCTLIALSGSAAATGRAADRAALRTEVRLYAEAEAAEARRPTGLRHAAPAAGAGGSPPERATPAVTNALSRAADWKTPPPEPGD